MTTRLATAVFLTFLPIAAAAEEVKSVDAPLCKQISSGVAERTKANFSRFSSDRTAVWFSHPMSRSIVVSCWSRAFINISLSTDSPFPNDLWFYLAAQAASAISPSPIEAIEGSMRDCQKEALASDGPAYRDVIDARIECYANTRDPGSQVNIYLRDEENRKVFKDQ